MKTEKPDIQKLWTLFKTCFIISACTFGGGMVIISMLQKKFVEDLHWIEQDEVMDMVAIAQSCPGVMAVNTSIIIGYRIAGLAGGLLTVLGTVTPPMIILTIISAFYVQFRSNLIVALILKGMQAGVAAVMINVTITMTRNVVQDGEILSWIMLIGACLAAVVFGIDIILILIVCGVIGGISTWIRYRSPAGNTGIDGSTDNQNQKNDREENSGK
ncbi:MAG: chromate transporter [Clostridiales bacterium]|nr:chromate transporter [Clostridiales bacterium]